MIKGIPAECADELLGSRGRGEQCLLRTLAGIMVSAAEARVLWPRILEHKWLLSERLGRDVGLRVAAADYFENIAPGGRRAA